MTAGVLEFARTVMGPRVYLGFDFCSFQGKGGVFGS